MRVRSRRGIAAIAVAAAVLIAVPTTAYAYWVVTAQATATARSATFSIAGPQNTSVSLAGSAADLLGFTGSSYASFSVTNTGAVAWASLDVALPQTVAFTAPAVVTLGAAVVAPSASCPTRAADYAAVPAAIPAAIAPGAAAKICTRIKYDRLSMVNRGSAMQAQLTVTPRLHNWAVASTPAVLTVAAPNAGIGKCTSGSGWFSSASVTIVAPAAGQYRIVVDGVVKSQKALAADETAAFTVAAEFLITQTNAPVRVQRQISTTTWVDIADASVSRQLGGAMKCT